VLGGQVRDLKGDQAVELEVAGQVDRAHAALAEEFLQLVLVEPRRQLWRQATDPRQGRLPRRGGVRIEGGRRQAGRRKLLGHTAYGLVDRGRVRSIMARRRGGDKRRRPSG